MPYMDTKAERFLELQLARVMMPNPPRRRSMVKSSHSRSFEEALSVHWGLAEAYYHVAGTPLAL